MTTAVKSQSRQEPEWMVWALVAIMLVIGFALMTAFTGGVQNFNQDGVAISYPAEWVKMDVESDAQILHAEDPFAAGYPTGMRLARIPLSDIGRNLEDPENLALAWTTQQSRERMAYTVIEVDSEATQVGANPAVVIEYAYVAPASGGGLPQVARAQDVLIPLGDQVWVLTFTADAANYEQSAAGWAKILASFTIP